MKAVRIVIFVLCSFWSASAFAQNVKVSSSLDTTAIMIGQQFKMNLKVEQPSKYKVVWPDIGDTLTNHVEIVEIGKLDTAYSADKSAVTFSRTYTLTSFDSGAYTIPSLLFITPGGQMFTDPLFIMVHKPAVDTTQGIKDIKGPLEIPFNWKEYIPHVLIGFAVLLIVGLIIFFTVRAIRNRRIAKANMPAYVPPPIPADERALTALLELQEKQLWQRGKNKEYYTELTDILRIYIKDIYLIDAPEMLTDEILQHLKFKEIDGEHKQALKAVLELADMVKFAKVTPTDTENVNSFDVANKFVKDTTSAIALRKAEEAKRNEKKGGKND